VTLRELSRVGWTPPEESAPDWLLGCFRRRSITFYNGVTDSSTQVYWLQSRGLSADFRIQTGSPELTTFEGGLGRTAWDGNAMKWFGWTSFQLHDKWSEPGALKRVGNCVMEFAPSGAYVEDWRLQPSRPGPVVGLRLLREWDVEGGAATHCGGGLIVCGDHAALVRGRKRNLHGLGRLGEVVRDAAQDPELLKELFAFEASYAVWDDACGYKTVFSTNGALTGQTLAVSDGFTYDPETKLVSQQVREGDKTLERIFLIDTLESGALFSTATSVDAETEKWLQRESDTLLAFASPRN
jgi:hypothetical protein